jgi:hypothetical protein
MSKAVRPLIARSMTFTVVIPYREPTYELYRGGPPDVPFYSTFEVNAASTEEAIRVAVSFFKDRAEHSGVRWIREIDWEEITVERSVKQRAEAPRGNALQTMIHIYQDNKHEGPYTVEQITDLLVKGLVAPITLAWKEGMSEWKPLDTVLPPLRETTPAPGIATSSDLQPIGGTAQLEVNGRKVVGGWLTFFCVVLGVVSPLWTLLTVTSHWQNSRPDLSVHPHLRTAIGCSTAAAIAIAAYGCVAGWRIMSGSPNGRRIARRYLMMRLDVIVCLSVACVVLTARLPSPNRDAWTQGIVVSTLAELGYFLIWWTYFKKSKRVLSTYGVDAR